MGDQLSDKANIKEYALLFPVSREIGAECIRLGPVFPFKMIENKGMWKRYSDWADLKNETSENSSFLGYASNTLFRMKME